MRLCKVVSRLTVLITSLFVAVSVSAEAGESDYILVDGMPDILGEKKRTLAIKDDDRGLQFLQEIYSEQFGHAWIQTFVLSVSCLDDGAEPSLVPHIMAIKYLPKKPASFTIATLHDIYKEVYVDAKEGRIRLYEDVSAHAMMELSESYLPRCLRI